MNPTRVPAAASTAAPPTPTSTTAHPDPTTGDEPAAAAPGGAPGAATAVLAAVGLVKHYGTTTALGGVALALHSGTSTAVMGPSGSGKSTLLHCLAGFTRADEGEVYVDGHRVDRLGERASSRLRRERFGFVFQSDQLLPELPAIENVALPLMLGGTPRRRAVKAASAWFGPLGLDGMEQRRPGQLSGGQLQRVAIARALVVAPSVVFADEPTAALDRATGQSTMAVLTQACRRANAALLVVTHDPEVAQTCDRVVRMRDGRVLDVRPSTVPGAGADGADAASADVDGADVDSADVDSADVEAGAR
jgi:putative ABC transport system ATP-binding protein